MADPAVEPGADSTRPPSVLARILVAPIRGYQRFVSPLLPPSCRFYPSCSQYAVQALRVHGAARGSWLAVRRLSRCAPWHPGGLDPVPPTKNVDNTRPDAGEVAKAIEENH